ncbi:hypothetical protein [Neptuniibacter caesariensis]|uniref:Uncharacterized protein n=1 Tax=Neptuniibacter caesariensis TaxID=207954 RepID=A0A7U8C4Z6_NEPCE|nr:hypothetical protein [Neptuniibacter caesariensis]EAR61568.1 hypothetical protein MED92_12976 [Oceanospirillum sp. MED92] [Neptuniibacter caesariensis]
MNKVKLYGKIRELLVDVETLSIPFVEVMHIFSSEALKFKEYDGFIQEQTVDQQKRAKITNQIQNAIRKEKEAYRPSQLLRSIINFEDRLDEISKLLPETSRSSSGKVLANFHNSLADFLHSFDNYKSNVTVGTGFSLALCSLELQVSLSILLPHLASMLPNNQIEDVGERVEINLYLSNVDSLGEFGKKLIAVEELYNVFVELNGGKVTESPIEIQNIENGSLVLSILSLPVVGEMLKLTLGRAASYIQGEYTRKGQIEGLPPVVSSIEGVLRISEQLQRNGIDTQEINEELQAATVKIARNINALIKDQPCVQINEELHDIGDDRAQLMIEQSKTMRLEDQSSPDTE